MNPELKKIEELEHKYFEVCKKLLLKNKNQIIKGLQSKNKIREDWIEKLSESDKRKKKIFDIGAERVIYHIFSDCSLGEPNSNPVASDLFFETEDSFVHIDLKTVSSKNIGDGNEKVTIARNQSSYKGKISIQSTGEERNYIPNLPYSYKSKNKTKYCLTYFIVIFYESEGNNTPFLIYITCMPNGLLRRFYGDDILGAGKQKKNEKHNQEARFVLKNCVEFKTLKNKKRIYVTYFKSDICKKYQSKLQFLSSLKR